MGTHPRANDVKKLEGNIGLLCSPEAFAMLSNLRRKPTFH